MKKSKAKPTTVVEHPKVYNFVDPYMSSKDARTKLMEVLARFNLQIGPDYDVSLTP